MTSKEYFSHDIDSSNDPALSAMIGEFKDKGYGIYWRTVEMLHKEGGFLSLNPVTFAAIARSIESDANIVKNVIEKSISDYKLFFSRNEKFFSKRVLKNLKKRRDEKLSKSKAGKASAEKRWGVTRVEQKLTGVQQIVTKERKVKESKKKSIKEKIQQPPTIEEVKNYFSENGYSIQAAEKAFRFYNEAEWYDSKGNKVKNWKQKMQGVWFKDENLKSHKNGELFHAAAPGEHLHPRLKTLN